MRCPTGTYFGASHAVSYLPAAAVLPYLKTRPINITESPLVVGDPTYAAGRNLRQLDGARTERPPSLAFWTAFH